MSRFGLFIVVSLLMGALCHAQESKAPAGASVAIRAGKVLDVHTGNYGIEQIIWIEGEKIKAIGKAAEIQKQLPAGAKIIDLSSLTVLPGLIDSHTHLTSSPQTLGPAGLRLSYPRRALLGARNARVTLAARMRFAGIVVSTEAGTTSRPLSQIIGRRAMKQVAGECPGCRSRPPSSRNEGRGWRPALAAQSKASSAVAATKVGGRPPFEAQIVVPADKILAWISTERNCPNIGGRRAPY
jgi:hypothetical protein